MGWFKKYIVDPISRPLEVIKASDPLTQWITGNDVSFNPDKNLDAALRTHHQNDPTARDLGITEDGAATAGKAVAAAAAIYFTAGAAAGALGEGGALAGAGEAATAYSVAEPVVTVSALETAGGAAVVGAGAAAGGGFADTVLGWGAGQVGRVANQEIDRAIAGNQSPAPVSRIGDNGVPAWSQDPGAPGAAGAPIGAVASQNQIVVGVLVLLFALAVASKAKG